MTPEEKQLLLKDLCARLPYHNLRVQYDNKDWLAMGYGHGRIELLSSYFSSIAGPCPLIEDIKPYLRPMSSMTEEKKEEYDKTFDWDYSIQGTPFDWLNEHHFDYRGLIEKGLALEAPEGMYKTE